MRTPEIQPRFGSQPRQHLQVRFQYGDPGQPPKLAVQEHLPARMPTKATSILWVGSSLRVGRVFARRAVRSYLVPTIQFLLKRRII